MVKIDTWLFVLMFMILYVAFFWLVDFTLLSFIISAIEMESFFTVYVVAITMSSLACFLAAYTLRSYYVLPTSLLRLITIITMLQFALNLFSVFFEKPDVSTVGGWFITALGTWLALFVSFWLSDQYFTKRMK